MKQIYSANFYIGSVLVKTKHNQLVIRGNTISVEPLAMSLLVYLAERQSQVVSSEELLKQLWQGKVVSENALHRIVRQLRKALNDDPSNPIFIRTVKKQGYSLIAKVSGLSQKKPSALLFASVLFLAIVFSMMVWWWPSPIIPIEVNQIRQLTSLTGFERDPVLLPDQRSMLFTHQPQGELYNNIVFKKLDQTDFEYLTNDYLHYANLTLANDNTHLAFVLRDDQNCSIQYTRISIEEREASEPITLFSCNFFSQNSLAWSFDAKYLYFTEHDPELLTSRIMKLNISDFSKQPLFENTKFNADYFLASQRGGDHFAFVRYDENAMKVLIYNSKTKFFEVVKTWDKKIDISAISWSHDNHSILLAGDNKITRLSLDGELQEINNAAFKDIDQLTTDNNGNVIYSTRNHRVRLKEITLDDPARPEKIISNTSSDEYAAIYNKDNQIFYLSDKESSYFRIWRKEQDKNTLVSDTFVAVFILRLSHNHQSLLSLTLNRELAIFGLAENSNTIVVDDKEIIGSYNWGRDDLSVFYSRMEKERFQIFNKNITSGEVTRLTQEGGYHMQQYGDYLYFNKFNQKGLWQLNLVTKETKKIIADFNQLNYTGWQIINDKIYYRRNSDALRGLYYFDLNDKTISTLYSDREIYLFDISTDESRVVISEKEKLSGDLFIARLE